MELLLTDHPEYLVGAPGSMAGRSPMGELNKLDIGVDDIDAVLLSHLHADHVGWLTTDTASGSQSNIRACRACIAQHFLDYVFGPAVTTGSTRHFARLE